jgi:hypothetical protein
LAIPDLSVLGVAHGVLLPVVCLPQQAPPQDWGSKKGT